MQLAACRGMDPNVFFPPIGRPSTLFISEARTVCARCICAKACLDYALANREEFGIWGGLTPEERQEITESRQASPQGMGEGSPARRRSGASKALLLAQGDPPDGLFTVENPPHKERH